MKIILLNGPPRAGKDYAGAALLEMLPAGTPILKFAQELKERTHALYRLVDAFGNLCPHDHFEDRKDDQLEEFEGITPRQAYIAVSEELIKPLHGQRIFGEWLARRIDQLEVGTVVITDSGFVPEAEVLVEKFGAENCLLARIHRKGYTFAGDSRSYLDLSHLSVQCQDINNDGGAGFRTSLATALRPASPA
tara:strand:- start:50251 stop:50826 length:576 start_codon:yes stop_codon:yes gene_type:complete